MTVEEKVKQLLLIPALTLPILTSHHSLQCSCKIKVTPLFSPEPKSLALWNVDSANVASKLFTASKDRIKDVLFGKPASTKFIAKDPGEGYLREAQATHLERQNRNITLPLPSLNMHVIDIRSEEVHGFSRYHLWDISVFAAHICQVVHGGNWTFFQEIYLKDTCWGWEMHTASWRRPMY